MRRAPTAGAGDAGSPAVDVGRPGTILGFFEQVAFHDVEIALDDTATLLVYTDGVSEARRGREYFGEQRIRDLVGNVEGSAADIAGALVAEVLEFQGDRPRDDIAIIAIRLQRRVVPTRSVPACSAENAPLRLPE